MARKKPNKPTEVQKRLLAFIQDFDDEFGYPPTFREMQAKVGISSTAMVNHNLQHLTRLGYIERDAKTSRGVRVVKSLSAQVREAASTVQRTVQDMLSISVVGRIFASQPVQVPSSGFNPFDAETTVNVALSMLPARNLDLSQIYALQVEGDSMIEDMVNDGDILIMQAAQEASNGDMVAVWLGDDEENTLKRFYREKDRIRLQPANPTMDPIYVTDAQSIEIQGKVLLIITPMKGRGS